MNTHVYKTIYVIVLLLSAYTSQAATPSALTPMATPILPAAVAAGEISPAEDVPQIRATTTKINVGLILGNFLILCLYSFPMSIGEGWALSNPMKAKKQPKTELPEMPEAIETPDKPALTISNEAPASTGDWTVLVERLSLWVQKLPSVVVGLVGGGCLMVAVVLVGAVAFALYYLFNGQPEKVGQILPWFAYWFPFALLGLVTDVPFTFNTFDWADRRQRVLLRLMVWWIPRLVIVAFMINLPILQDLDPATTALAVLVIDGVLAAFFLWLHMSRKQIRMKGI